jgi:hypothetical protein
MATASDEASDEESDDDDANEARAAARYLDAAAAAAERPRIPNPISTEYKLDCTIREKCVKTFMTPHWKIELVMNM